jgi:hypothetical protein
VSIDRDTGKTPNAAPLQSSSTPPHRLDLEVIAPDARGNPTKSVFYSYDQLLTLPTVTVKTERARKRQAPIATLSGFSGVRLS